MEKKGLADDSNTKRCRVYRFPAAACVGLERVTGGSVVALSRGDGGRGGGGWC